MKNLIVITVILFVLAACNEREGCDGYPYVAWTIPDTTLVIGLDSLIVDLTGSDQSLLRHSADKHLKYSIQVDIGVTISVVPKNDNDRDGKWAIFYPKNPGEYTIGITVSDECDKEDYTIFKLIAATN